MEKNKEYDMDRVLQTDADDNNDSYSSDLIETWMLTSRARSS